MRRTMTKPIAIIDGDLLAFKSSAVCEQRSIEVTHIPSNRKKVFKTRREMKSFVDLDKFPIEDFLIKDVQTPEDVSFALHTAKQMIKKICDACETNQYEIYLSGPNNFRDKLPLPQRYKGNREGLMRPLLLSEVKEYLIKYHKAEVVEGEADDKLSIRQWEGYKTKQKIIGCSTDKDSLGTFGWVFNWDKMQEPMFIEGLGELYLDEKGKIRGHGNKWKYIQWTLGDTADGLNPTYLCGARFGEKTAYKLFSNLKTEKECWKAVHDLYLKWYPQSVEYIDQNGAKNCADYLNIAQIYWDGIHMMRWEGDRVNIKQVMKNMEII